MKTSFKISAIAMMAFLAGCSSEPEVTQPTKQPTTTAKPVPKPPPGKNGSRYSMTHDAEPANLESVDHIQDAVPHYEPLSRRGNRDYKLRGGDYKIIRDPRGFTQTGYASWYGAKFQGHETSNGEIYDIYQMTAAHKTLPLPSYVKVTNTDNGKSVIVRVNDRGPFHDGRVIDLSYAAAYKLGVYQKGTAPVKLEYIDTSKHPQKPIMPGKENLEYLVQVAAVSNKEKARTLAKNLGQSYAVGALINSEGGINRVILGPLTNETQADYLLRKLRADGHPQAYIKEREKK
ncbi:MAG: septal ring lytic transglycosylase RlpA family protein [Vibrio sp.]